MMAPTGCAIFILKSDKHLYIYIYALKVCKWITVINWKHTLAKKDQDFIKTWVSSTGDSRSQGATNHIYCKIQITSPFPTNWNIIKFKRKGLLSNFFEDLWKKGV